MNELEMFYQRMIDLGVKIPKIDGFEYYYRNKKIVYYKTGEKYKARVAVEERQLIEYQQNLDKFKTEIIRTYAKVKAKESIRSLEPNRYGGGFITKKEKKHLI